jgi:hypothetical protein
MTADPAFILANLVNQQQAANYGSLVDLLVTKGVVSLEEVKRAKLRAEAMTDQVTAGDHARLSKTESGRLFLDLLGKGEDDE